MSSAAYFVIVPLDDTKVNGLNWGFIAIDTALYPP